MNIVVVGIGYVGIVTAVCLAEKGHNVTCVDVDSKKNWNAKKWKSTYVWTTFGQTKKGKKG